MQITVFGASGKIGSLVVDMALSRGYNVVAFVHNSNPFEETKQLKVVRGDVADDLAVAKALEGSGAVISALGSWGTKDKNALRSGMQSIIPVMESAKISRLITLTGSGAEWSGDKPTLVDKSTHVLLGLVAPRILKDGEEHLRMLDGSSLDWTCIRSPVMNNKDSELYKLDFMPPSLVAKVSRKAVAKCLIDQIKNSSYSRQSPHIHTI